jgi:hypothetical protein
MNQTVHRIGRTRKSAGKDTALIYTIYLSHTLRYSKDGKTGNKRRT